MAENDRLPYMPKYGHQFYGDDKVLVMDFAQKGMYDELLWRQWQNGSVPADVELLRCMLKPAIHEAKTWKGFVNMLDSLFPVVEGDPYSRQNLKLEEVRANAIRVLEAKSLGGKKGAETRRQLQESTVPPGTDLHKGKGREGKGGVSTTKKYSPHIQRTTWMTPYADAWVERMGNGSHPPYGRIGKAFKKVHAEYGPDVVAARFRMYLAATKAEFCKPENFVQTFGEWDPDAGTLGAEFGFDENS